MTGSPPVNPFYAARLHGSPDWPILRGTSNSEARLPAPGPFARYAMLYREHGYAPIPIMPETKRPTVRDWSRWCHELPPPELVQAWAREYARAGIAIALGPASAIVALDLDEDVDGLHGRILEAAGPSPVGKKGRKGATYFYSHSNGQRSRSFSRQTRSVAEILSTGRMSVLPPSIHPETRRPYEWITPETLLDRDPASLPPLDAARISAIFEPTRLARRQRVTPEQPATAALLAEALRYISPDCDYHTWIKVGTALKAALGEAGFDLWDSWSSASAKYDGRQMLAKWESFDPERVSPATILYLARQCGYRHQR